MKLLILSLVGPNHDLGEGSLGFLFIRAYGSLPLPAFCVAVDYVVVIASFADGASGHVLSL